MGEYADDALDAALNDHWPGWRDLDEEIGDVLPSYPVKHHFGTVRAEADDCDNDVDGDDGWDSDPDYDDDDDLDLEDDSWIEDDEEDEEEDFDPDEE